MPKPSQNQQFGAHRNILNLLSHPVLSGVGTIVSLIAAIRSEDILVRAPATIVALAFGSYFLYIVRPWLRSGLSWLTQKFFLGFALGIIIGIIITPIIFEPSLSTFMALVSPRVSFLDSTPENGKTIYSPSSSVLVRFSEPIPWRFHDYIKVKIYPQIPIELSWIGEQELVIHPKKIYPERDHGGIANPRFELNSNYHVTVSGPLLKQPINVDFQTPKQ